LDEQLPETLPVGRGTALFVRGECQANAAVRRLSVSADGIERPAMASGMPAPAGRGGFWGIVPLAPPARPVDLGLSAELSDGGTAKAELGTIGLEPPPAAPAEAPAPPGPDSEPLVSVCMATFEAPPELLNQQIASLRAQTHRNWICLISDDASSDEAYSAVEQTVAGDRRFRLSRSDRRLGFYRNFERAMAMVPAEARFVALADQDDRWHRDKLSTLVAAIGDAQLAYSDARAIRPDGSVLAETLWERRRNNRTNLASLLLSNTVTGAAALLRRELLDLVLPLPPAPGTPYHDHWVALVALATGALAYVDRPLFDYVQHPQAVLGYEAIGARAQLRRGERLRRLIREPGSALDRWREAYFDEWCRTLVFATVLDMRCGDRLAADKRRAMHRVLAGERSAITLAWLAARPARSLAGRNETRGFEHRLLRGLAWRHLVKHLSRNRAAAVPPGGQATDA
jgi:glycosyltransferase involved in cell wall biosynthesis